MWNECPLIFGLQVVSANLATILTTAEVSRDLMVWLINPLAIICVGPPRCHCIMQINNDIFFSPAVHFSLKRQAFTRRQGRGIAHQRHYFDAQPLFCLERWLTVWMWAQWSARRKSADWRRPSEASWLPTRDVTLAYLLATAELSGPCLLAGGHFRRWLDKVAARYVCGWLLVAADQIGGCRQLFSNVVSESKRRGQSQLTLITSSRIGFGFWRFFRVGNFFWNNYHCQLVNLLQ